MVSFKKCKDFEEDYHFIIDGVHGRNCLYAFDMDAQRDVHLTLVPKDNNASGLSAKQLASLVYIVPYKESEVILHFPLTSRAIS